MKCDDDNEVDIFQLEDYLHSIELYDDEILCCVREDAVPSRIQPPDKWWAAILLSYIVFENNAGIAHISFLNVANKMGFIFTSKIFWSIL